MGGLPGVVGGAVGGCQLSSAVYVVDAGLGLVDGGQGIVLDGYPRVATFGEGIDRHGFEVASLYQVVERVGGLLLVYGVGVDGGAHGVEIFFEDGLFRVADVIGVGRDGDGREQTDHDHDDHEFEQGEALLGVTRAIDPTHRDAAAMDGATEFLR